MNQSILETEVLMKLWMNSKFKKVAHMKIVQKEKENQ